jgi:hypothetical protein
MRRTRLARAGAVGALLAIPVFLFGDRALAIQDSEDKVLFGPVGIAVGEGARVHVYAVGNPNDAPWTFTLQVFNRLGAVVQAGKLQVAPGAIGSFELVGDANERAGISALPVRRTLRVEVVGFQPPPDPDSPPPDPERPGKYVATMEVYSLLTGRTSLVIGDPDILPAATPPPEPDLPAANP